jgi:hypothetical protein
MKVGGGRVLVVVECWWLSAGGGGCEVFSLVGWDLVLTLITP